jgi:Lon protease-like protein
MTTLPLFPLRTVLFPGGLLPLRIFEARYVDMVGRCMREGGVFGVVLIREGAEVGPLGALAEIGTSARIIDFEQLPDGLLGLLCRGEQRFRLGARRSQPDGLNIGDVEWLPAAAPLAMSLEQQPLAAVLRRVVPELGKLASHLLADYDSVDWVSNRFAELLPLERSVQQQLLEMDDPAQRLATIAPLVRTD